jgi:hypothetical protein
MKGINTLPESNAIDTADSVLEFLQDRINFSTDPGHRTSALLGGALFLSFERLGELVLDEGKQELDLSAEIKGLIAQTMKVDANSGLAPASELLGDAVIQALTHVARLINGKDDDETANQVKDLEAHVVELAKAHAPSGEAANAMFQVFAYLRSVLIFAMALKQKNAKEAA